MKKKLLSIVLSIAMVVTMMPAQTLVVSAASKTTATVSTQKALKKAIKSKKLKTLTIKTSKKRNFSIPKGSHSKVNLIVDAPKSTVKNKSLFKTIKIKNILPSETSSGWTEYKKGNTFIIEMAAGRMAVANGASVKEVRLSVADSKMTFNVGGELKKVNVEKKATLNFIGGTSSTTLVNISRGADKTALTSSIELSVYVEPNADIAFEKGAEGSEVIYSDTETQVKVTNNTNGRVFASNAEGEQVLVKTTETFNSAVYEKEQAEKEAKEKEEQQQGTDPDPQKPSVKYTVKYVLNDGESWEGQAPATVSYEEGSTVELTSNYPVKYSRLGDELLFWAWEITYKRSDGTLKSVYVYDDEFTMPAANVTVKGVWEADNTYKIEYREIDGSPITKGLDEGTPEYFEYGEEVELLGATKSGYAFVGWLLDPADKKVVTSLDGFDDEDITLYAKWVKLEKLQGKVFYLTDEGKDCYDFYDSRNKKLEEDNMKDLFNNAVKYAQVGYPKADCVYMVAVDNKGDLISNNETGWAQWISESNKTGTAIGMGKQNTNILNEAYVSDNTSLWYWMNEKKSQNPGKQFYIGSKDEVKELSKVLDDRTYWSSTTSGNKVCTVYDGVVSLCEPTDRCAAVAILSMGESANSLVENAKDDIEELVQTIYETLEGFQDSNTVESIKYSISERQDYINNNLDQYSSQTGEQDLTDCKKYINATIVRFETYIDYLEQIQGIDKDLENNYAYNYMDRFVNVWDSPENWNETTKLQNDIEAGTLIELLGVEVDRKNSSISETLKEKDSKYLEKYYGFFIALNDLKNDISEKTNRFELDTKYDSIVELRSFILKKYKQIEGFVEFLSDNDVSSEMVGSIFNYMVKTLNSNDEAGLLEVMKLIKQAEIQNVKNVWDLKNESTEGILYDIAETLEYVITQATKAINNSAAFGDILLASEVGQQKVYALRSYYNAYDSIEELDQLLSLSLSTEIGEQISSASDLFLAKIKTAKDKDAVQSVIENNLKPIVITIMNSLAEEGRTMAKAVLNRSSSKRIVDDAIEAIKERISENVTGCEDVSDLMDNLTIEYYMILGIMLTSNVIDTPITTATQNALDTVYTNLPKIKDESMDEIKDAYITLGKCILPAKIEKVNTEFAKVASCEAKNDLGELLAPVATADGIDKVSNGMDAFGFVVNKMMLLDSMEYLLPKIGNIFAYITENLSGRDVDAAWQGWSEKKRNAPLVLIQEMFEMSNFNSITKNTTRIALSLMNFDTTNRRNKINQNIKKTKWDDSLKNQAGELLESSVPMPDGETLSKMTRSELDQLWDFFIEILEATEALSNLGDLSFCGEIALKTGKVYVESTTTEEINTKFYEGLESAIDEALQNSIDISVLSGDSKTSIENAIEEITSIIDQAIADKTSYKETIDTISFPLAQIGLIAELMAGCEDQIWGENPSEKLQTIMAEIIDEISEANDLFELETKMQDWKIRLQTGLAYDRSSKISSKSANLFNDELNASIENMMSKVDEEISASAQKPDQLENLTKKIQFMEDILKVCSDKLDGDMCKAVANAVNAISADSSKDVYKIGAEAVNDTYVESVKDFSDEVSASCSQIADGDVGKQYKEFIGSLKQRFEDLEQKELNEETPNLSNMTNHKEVAQYKLSTIEELIDLFVGVGDTSIMKDLSSPVKESVNGNTIEEVNKFIDGIKSDDVKEPMSKINQMSNDNNRKSISNSLSDGAIKTSADSALKDYGDTVSKFIESLHKMGTPTSTFLSEWQLIETSNEQITVKVTALINAQDAEKEVALSDLLELLEAKKTELIDKLQKK